MTQAIYFISAFALAGLVVAAAGRGTELTVPVSPGTSPPASRFQPLPAAPIQPLIQAKRAEAEQARKSINQGRLSKQQLRQTLLNHPNPRIRGKAQEAQKASTYQSTKVVAPSSVTLTPQVMYSALPTAWLSFFGANIISWANEPSTVMLEGHFDTYSFGGTIVQSVAEVDIVIPSTDWYLIDFYGRGNPKATLRTYTDPTLPFIVLESWDMTTSPASNNHFATAEYLAKGGHTFYFTVESKFFDFFEVSIEAF